LSVSEQLRSLRQKKGASLQSVADSLGVSVSHLSRIERGLADPTLGQLRKLADLYGTTLREIFENDEGALEDKPVLVTRSGQRRQLFSNGVQLELLSGYPLKNIEAMIAYYPPPRGSDRLYTHRGEEINLVLEGEIIYVIGDEKYRLGRGDSICHSSELPHGWENPHATTCAMMTVVAPASFMF